MRIHLTAISLLAALCSAGSMPAQQVHGFPTLQQGTAVSLQLDEPLNSAHARIGQRVAFEVKADVLVQNQVLIPAGASALGTVAMVAPHGWTGHSWHERAGRLSVNVDAVRLPSGQIVPLCAAQDATVQDGNIPDGTSTQDGVAPSPMSSSMIGVRHRDVLIPEGTVLRAYVRRDTVIVQQTASVSN